MVPSCQSRFTFLAAGRVSAVADLPTISPKTRVGGFRRRPSGRLSSRGRDRSMFTPGSRRCGYKSASGLGKWLNRDPIGENGGINLFEFVDSNPNDHIDLYGLEGPGATWGEALNDIACCPNPKALEIARLLAQQAQIAAKNRFPFSMWNGGPADSFRHCVWNCWMVRAIGEKCAAGIAANHEKAGNSQGQSHDDYSMDSWNNAVGRGMATDPGDCKDLCAKGVNNGQLTVNNPKPPKANIK